jgi:hypothetical protein
MTKDREPARERFLFGLLLLLHTAFTLWLIFGRRMVRTHDTLYVYLTQYFFQSHALTSPDPALWLPTVAHGAPTNFHAMFQGGLFQNILLLFGGVPAGSNFLPWFYVGMYLDEVILLVGVWSLGRRYYSSSLTRFFVGAAILGSTFWASQHDFNLKTIYALPLILSLLHDAVEHGRRRSLLLAGGLGALQLAGTAAYLSVFVLLVVVAYFVSHAFLHRTLWKTWLKRLRFRLADPAIVAVCAAIAAAIYVSLSGGASALRQFRPGRNPDGSVTLDAFLTFATNLKPTRYLDFFLGISPSMDYTLYCGVATLAFAAAALIARPGKPVLHLLICLLLVLLFTTGYLSVVGAVAYEGVPPMRYFRYVGMMSPLVKIFVILISGYGFDALVAGRLDGVRFTRGTAAGCAGVALLALAGLTREGQTVLSDFFRTGSADVANRPAVLGAFPTAILAGTGLAAAALAGVLFLHRIGLVTPARLIVLLLALQTVDVFRWKFQMFREETVPIGDRLYALNEVRPLPFITRRREYESSERLRTLEPALSDHGARYDLLDGFVHLDPPATQYFTSYWLAPFEALVQAHDRRPVDQRIGRPALLQPLPSADPYAKISGAAEEKIQIFSRAHAAGSDQALADFMNLPGFKGDVLLLSPRPGGPAEDLTPELLTANHRIRTKIRLLQFDANSITLGVTLPPEQNGGWLSYCDVWDAGWTATVNQKPTPVERSFLAYKAVRLDRGVNVIHFRFQAPTRVWGYRLIYLASLLCVLGVLAEAVLLLARRTDPPVS